MLFDTHTHYDDERFTDDKYEVIERAHNSGIKYMLNASSDIASCSESVSLAEKYAYVYAAVGVHPHNVEQADHNTLNIIRDYAKSSKAVAIGEIGLDYYYDNSPRELQRQWFIKQIHMAIQLNLPIIVHNRDAHMDTLKIVKQEEAKKIGGVFHCYSGSVEMAREVLDNNFYISVGGVVTFKNASRISEVVRFVPEDMLLIETDCPYLTPEPFRGKRNESSYIRFIAEKIAEIKGTSFEYIAYVTTENAKRLFKVV